MEEPAAPNRRPVKRRRRGGRLLATLFFLAVFAAFLYGFASTLFFNIESIVVTGLPEESPYSATELVAASGVQPGQNLFRARFSSLGQALEEKFPYLGTVHFAKHYPDLLEIQVALTQPVAYLQNGQGAWLLDQNFKVLEKITSPEEAGLPELRGLDAELCELGKVLQSNNPKNLKLKVDIIGNIVDNYKVSDIDYIDVEDTFAIKFGYMDRFEVRLGDGSQMAEKAALVDSILAELGSNEKGTVVISDAEKGSFIPRR